MSMIRFLNTRFEYSLLICATYVGFWMVLHIIRPQSMIQLSYYYSYYFSKFESTHLFGYSLLISATYVDLKDLFHIIRPPSTSQMELLLLLLFLRRHFSADLSPKILRVIKLLKNSVVRDRL